MPLTSGLQSFGAPLQRRSVRGHQVPLDEVRTADDAVKFVFDYRYWFRYHDKAREEGIEDPRWIPAGFTRIELKHGCQEAYQVKRWAVYVYDHKSTATAHIHLFEGDGQPVIVEAQCVVVG